MRPTALSRAFLAMAASCALLAAGGPAEAQRGGYGAGGGFGLGGFGGGRAGLARGGSYGSSRARFGGIGFGPGYGPGFGGAVSRGRLGRNGYGYGPGFGGGYGRGVSGFGGPVAHAGIAPSPVLPPAVYSMDRGRGGVVRGAASEPRAAGPLLIVIGNRR